MSEDIWQGKHYSFFQNKECEYFPCHNGVDEQFFNCLFCYCPLYMLGKDCGGNPIYTEQGIKDCSNCQIPHDSRNYGMITGKFSQIIDKMKEERS